MDSIFEKITLYDVLGYWVSGCFFLFIGFIEYIIDTPETCTILMKDFFVLFVVVSYICGIMVSEVGSWIVILLRNYNNYKAVFEDVDSNSIRKALENGNVITELGDADDSSNEIADYEKYFKRMYADIQVDSQYKRIHNYASATLLYKNLFTAVLLGGICRWGTACIFHMELKNNKIWFLGLFILFIVFFIRYRRFDKKKIFYTVEWYIKKYNT